MPLDFSPNRIYNLENSETKNGGDNMLSVNSIGMKRALLINDLSCLGKCSLSVAMPIISAYGIETAILPTALLSTHTAEGFGDYVMRDLTRELSAFTAHWKALGVKFDCIYTGFFGSVEQIKLTEKLIDEFADDNTLIMIDPVLGDFGGLYGCFDEAFVGEMRRLCSLADIITPNKTEAALLTSCAMETDANELLEKLGAKNAVITGVKSGGEIGYLASFGGEKVSIMKRMIPKELHGTGDVFASAFCAELMNGKDYHQALTDAADFCDECIKATEKKLPNHWYGLAFEEVLRKRMGL